MARGLFVYGSLRDPDILFAVIGHALSPSALIDATAINHRAVLYPGRTYPALAHYPGEDAEGVIVYTLSPADLMALDAFEGGEYQRSLITVQSGHATQIADVYWPVAEIDAGAPRWDYGDWARNHKATMLVGIHSAAIRELDEDAAR